MNIFFLIAVALALAPTAEPLVEPADAWLHLACTLAGVASIIGLARAIAVSTVHRLRCRFDDRSEILARYHRMRRAHGAFGVIAFAAILHFAGWATLVRWHMGLADWILVDELLMLAPYLFAEVAAIACFYSVEEALRQKLAECGYCVANPITRRRYLDFQVRAQIGVWLVATVVLAGMRDLCAWISTDDAETSTVALLTVGLTSISVLALSPVIIRIVWQATPLPDGPVRDRLEDFARRVGFAFSDILVWQTNGGVANAAITGLIPQLRYVLLSDALLEHLAADEVEAVFGHEVGHVKHHHLSYYLGFVVASLVFITLISFPASWMARWLLGESLWKSLEPTMTYLPPELWLFVPYFAIVFGHLSRRFERQADLYGCRTARMVTDDPSLATEQPPLSPVGISTFIRSLEKVAAINGIGRSAWSWRHDSIARRVEFLSTIIDSPSVVITFHRRLRRLQWFLALVLMFGIALLGWLVWPIL